MIKNLRAAIFILITGVFFLSGCLPEEIFQGSTTSTPTSAFSITPIAPIQTPTRTPKPLSNQIEIWIPDQLDPAATPLGSALTARVADFQKLHPEYEFILRVKPGSGKASILTHLEATTQVAPQELPSLILFNQNQLRYVVDHNWVVPAIPPVDLELFYDYAQWAVLVNGQVYGRPLIADTLVLVYQPVNQASQIGDLGWQNSIDLMKKVQVFDGEELADLALGLYASLGGPILEESSTIAFDDASILAILQSFEDLRRKEIIQLIEVSPQSTPFNWDDQAKGAAQAIILPYSSLVALPATGVSVSPLPGFNQGYYSLMNTWSWAVTNTHQEHQQIAQELAVFLSTPEFQAAWLQPSGYLPVDKASAETWPDQEEKQRVQQIILASQPYPEVRSSLLLNEKLTELMQQILRLEISAPDAANNLLENNFIHQ